MKKIRFTSRIQIKNGKVRANSVLDLPARSARDQDILGYLKPMMNNWIRDHLSRDDTLNNAEILVRAKYTESSSGVGVDFKIKGVTVEKVVA